MLHVVDDVATTSEFYGKLRPEFTYKNLNGTL